MAQIDDEQSVDFWRSRYEALSARIVDDTVKRNAIELVESSLRLSWQYNRPFREVFTTLLDCVYRQRARKHTKQ